VGAVGRWTKTYVPDLTTLMDMGKSILLIWAAAMQTCIKYKVRKVERNGDEGGGETFPPRR
jgi:hypothetical protein